MSHDIPTIILARGGSKGIPKKNIIDFCGKPLISWTIDVCKKAGSNQIYVSSDCDEILTVSEKFGAKGISRPEFISGDKASSESAWIHAIDYLKTNFKMPQWVLAPQVTSPLRTSMDVKRGLDLALSNQFDSLFSCSVVDDLFFWEKTQNGLESKNYDWKNRKPRQDSPKQYIENGSFYLFRPEVIQKSKNRFGGKIGMIEMEFWKMFEIDTQDDLRMCSVLMKEFLL